MSEIGKIMSQVHSVSTKELHDLPPKWEQFLKTQIEQCQARHRRLGMPEWFLNEIDKTVITSIPNEESVILTGEYTPFNLLVSPTDGVWHITGMIDFGDAMIGFREYDFLGPCLFLGGGQRDLIESLFSSYRYSSPCVDQALRGRLMSLAILHRYSNLRLQIRIQDWETRVNSLLDLQRLIFPQ